jgi:Xaa-Pro aminopeptidase
MPVLLNFIMRIEELQKKLDEKKIDLGIVFSIDEKPNTTMVYLTGYSGIGVLAILQKKSFLIVPDMEYEKAKKTSKIKVFKTEKKKRLIETLVILLKKEKIKKIGIEESSCSVALYKRVKKGLSGKFCDIGSPCSMIRMKKDAKELQNIKKACSVTDFVFNNICKNFKFKTEEEMKKFIEIEFSKKGCELAFPSIVASAKATSQPHYAGSNKIKPGFLMIDFGAKYKGYCADMTRMLYIGRPKKTEADDYALVLDTVIKCEKKAEIGKKWSELYDLAIKNLDKKAKYFTHSLGHGLGLDIHESPSLSAEEKNIISDNVPFTIEPGIYFEGKYGIRIEDTVVLVNKKLVWLTRSKKDLVIIDKKQ